MMKRIKHSLFQMAVAFDQFINTLCGGWADETLSARCWRKRAYKGWNRASHVINTIFFWQDNHCREAHESEWNRAHLPPSLRGEVR